MPRTSFAKSQTAVDERTAALQFMAQVMDGVKALDDNSPRKIEYMQKRIPEAYAVLTNDQPITVATRLARAHREGFALFGPIGSARPIGRRWPGVSWIWKAANCSMNGRT